MRKRKSKPEPVRHWPSWSSLAFIVAVLALVVAIMSWCSVRTMLAPPVPADNMLYHPAAQTDDGRIVVKPELDYDCWLSQTENGWHNVCMPRQVDPTDCPAGQTLVCVRRYGNRSCDCYPE